ncbi:transposase [Escherichia coli]|uniref:Transposase n=1 Tax=Escherichia coli TaxID=562 RepID=A0A377E5Y5_ECOLX|nr:transposase [Escherichia coli]
MIDVLGPEKRRRRTTQEKIAIVQQSFGTGDDGLPRCPATWYSSQPVISLA